MEKITTGEVMDNLDMFQYRFVKIEKFGRWDLEIISADAGMHFTLTDFKEEFQARGLHLTLAAPEHQEMNVQVKVTWRTLRKTSHSLMVHARELIYTTDNIFPVIPIKDLINEDSDLTPPFKLATGKKPSVSQLCVLFFPCVARKATAHVDKKALNMRHQAQKGFCGIFVEIPQHQKGYIV